MSQNQQGNQLIMISEQFSKSKLKADLERGPRNDFSKWFEPHSGPEGVKIYLVYHLNHPIAKAEAS